MSSFLIENRATQNVFIIIITITITFLFLQYMYYQGANKVGWEVRVKAERKTCKLSTDHRGEVGWGWGGRLGGGVGSIVTELLTAHEPPRFY